MKINDILGLGKVLPIDKLINVLSSITGRLSKPYFDRKDIDTKVYEIKKIAEAKAAEMKIISEAIKSNFQITGGIEYKDEKLVISSPPISNSKVDNSSNPKTQSLEERTTDRINFQEAKKQLNIESITSYTAEFLKDEPPVTDEPIDEDWKNRFFRIAEDISTDEMQALWGRILAGEIKQPKSYSLRTLETLKNLNKREAECFLKFGKLAITSAGTSFIINFKGEKLLEEKYGLSFAERLLLEELGLMAANDLNFILQPSHIEDRDVIFTIGKIGLVAKKLKDTPQQLVDVLVFTKIGQELLQLIETTPNFDYLQLLAAKIKHENMIIRYGKISDDGTKIENLLDMPAANENEIYPKTS